MSSRTFYVLEKVQFSDSSVVILRKFYENSTRSPRKVYSFFFSLFQLILGIFIIKKSFPLQKDMLVSDVIALNFAGFFEAENIMNNYEQISEVFFKNIAQCPKT